jgi:16S rRNA (cytosine1402-N4)-methyltransferase
MSDRIAHGPEQDEQSSGNHHRHTDDTEHLPVLMEQVLHWASPQPGSIWVDGTAGGGGHSLELLKRLGPGGRLLAIDRDPLAAQRVRRRLEDADIEATWSVHQASYAQLASILADENLTHVDGVLLDLGLSSDQLADAERGFSFRLGGPLDLRFDPTGGYPAWELLEHLPEKELADLIYRYGEERFSRRIARRIVERRRSDPIRTAEQLVELIHRCVPGRVHGRVDSATRTFQALRIAVNQELKHLELALRDLPDLLRTGGRLLMISFHSLEDRLVKHAFREDPRLEVLTKKPVTGTPDEVMANPRARSAKLRVAERLP